MHPVISFTFQFGMELAAHILIEDVSSNKILCKMEVYDEFSCNIGDAEKTVTPVPPLHGNITDKEAEFRLKQFGLVGSYLIRNSRRSGKFGEKKYIISFAISSLSGSLHVLHSKLEIEIGSEDKIPELLRKQDPTRKTFVTPLYPDARIEKMRRQYFKCEKGQEKILTRKNSKLQKAIFRCLECDFNSVVKMDLITHFKTTHNNQKKNLREKEQVKESKQIELKIHNTLSSYGIINQNKIIVGDNLDNEDVDNIVVF